MRSMATRRRTGEKQLFQPRLVGQDVRHRTLSLGLSADGSLS